LVELCVNLLMKSVVLTAKLWRVVHYLSNELMTHTNSEVFSQALWWGTNPWDPRGPWVRHPWCPGTNRAWGTEVNARHVTSAVCLRCMPAVMAYWEMQLFSCFLIRPWIRTLIRSLHFLYRKSLNSLNRFSSIFSFIYMWYMNLLFILNIKTLGSLFSGGCTGNFSYYRLWSNTSHSVPSCVASVSNYVNSYQYDPYTHPSFLANRQQDIYAWSKFNVSISTKYFLPTTTSERNGILSSTPDGFFPDSLLQWTQIHTQYLRWHLLVPVVVHCFFIS